MVQSSDKMRSTREGNGKPLQYSCLEDPMNSMKRQKDRTLKDELPRSVGAQYATGDQWRDNSRKNEEMKPKQNQQLVVDITIAKFRLKLKKVGKTTRPFRYDLNQIPYDYTVEARNSFKGLDLMECLMIYEQRFVTLYRRQGLRPSPRKRNAKKQNGYLRRSYK